MVGGEHGRGENVEGLPHPEEISGAGAEEDGGCGELEGRDGKMLNGAGDALGDEPGGLQTGNGLCEQVGFALVEDFFLRHRGHGDVVFLYQVTDLLRRYGKGVVVLSLQHEAAAIGVEAVSHGPVLIP